MEKRNINYGKSIVKEDQVEPQPPAGVWLRSNFPGILHTSGSITGNRYTFNGGGSVVEVDAKDAPGLLLKTYGGVSCCGSNSKPSPMFVAI